MSVVITKGDHLLGVPFIKVRNVLKAWRYGKDTDAHEISVRKDVGIDVRTVMILLDELRDRGLIGEEQSEHERVFDGLTEAGEAFVRAKGTKRTPKQKAQIILDQFIDRCSAINARDDLPFDIQEVWLFGSMLDDRKSDVADIDIVMVLGRPDKYKETAQERFEVLAEELGGDEMFANSGVMASFRRQDYVTNQFLYGGRKHPLLAPNDIGQLHILGCPCKRIFDKKKSGKIDNPILPKHPNSPGKSNRLGPKHEMPDLGFDKKPLRPLPADLVEPYHFHFVNLMATGPWSLEYEAFYRLVQDQQNNMHVLTKNSEAIQGKMIKNAVLKRLDLENLDERNRVGFLICDRIYENPNDYQNSKLSTKFGAVVERLIKEEKTKVVYEVNIADGDTKGRVSELSCVLGAVWWIYFMMTADLEHIVCRDDEAGVKRPIRIIIKANQNKRVAGEISEYLNENKDALIAWVSNLSPEAIVE